jgi:hypothetical protein
MVKITIKQVIGRAGTGKTTYAKKVAEYHLKRNKMIYCLSLTHSAVENMRRRGFSSKCNFSTLHSFFRIDFSGEVMGCYLPFDVLIIDEFSLISSDLLDKCIRSIFKFGDNDLHECEIYLVGDPLQLGSINTTETIEYTVLDKALHVLPLNTIPVDNIMPIIRHWGSLCINSPLVNGLTSRSKILANNYRSNDTIMKLVEDIVFKGNLLELLPNLYTSDEIVKRVRDNGYTVIASSYNTLKKINERVRTEANTLKYHNWLYSPNETVYLTINTSSLYNGEYATLLTADATSVTIKTDHGKNVITDMFIRNFDGLNINEKVPIVMPAYLYTFHKSQGLEFDNVAICIDNLFEFPMLYTGITRSKKNVIFFTMNSLLYKDIDETVNIKSFKDIYTLSGTDESLKNSVQNILQKYINSGTLEITTINDIYKNITDE